MRQYGLCRGTASRTQSRKEGNERVTGVRKPSAIEVFEDNMAGAARLIGLTKALENTRRYRMRKERREALGIALDLPKRDWNKLDWVESPDLFVILKPNGEHDRTDFTEPELRPLLRQAVVAIAAAVESYVAEKACSYISEAFDSKPDRLKQVSISVGQVMEIDERYERRRWGYREVVRDYLVAEASPSPSKIGIVFSTVGKKGFWATVDRRRGVAKGVSERQLNELAERRNRIAHTGDRVGRGRATLTVEEAESYFSNAKEIVEALESSL
jgi:hypothetical protein